MTILTLDILGEEYEISYVAAPANIPLHHSVVRKHDVAVNNTNGLYLRLNIDATLRDFSYHAVSSHPEIKR